MHRKTRLRLKLNENEKPVVKVGERVKTGDILAKSVSEEIIEIPLAKLLQVKPKDVIRYLVKELPTDIEKNEVIAVKKGLLKQCRIKSPRAGVLDYLDATSGTLQIIPKDKEAKQVRSWFEGTVKEVSDREVICEVSGIVIKGKSGDGDMVSGKLFSIKDKVDLFNLPTDINERILILKSAKADMIAKADALGALAVITEFLEEPPFSLPYLIVEDIRQIIDYDGMPAILHPEEKQLLIMEEVAKNKK